MAERCARCNVNGNEVRLYNAIYDGRMGQICERCSIIENVPIIKKPNISQLKESERGGGVYERVRKISGFGESEKKETFFIEDKLKELDKKPELELPEKDKLNLVEHFHWVIMKNRRHRGLTQEKLAESLGESELAIKMIEKAQIPENADVLIKKLEQFFQIRLRKISEEEKLMKERQRKPVLLDEGGNILESIPEPELKTIEPEESEFLEDFEEVEEEPFEEKFVEESGKVMDLDVKKVDLGNVTIKDLKGLHRKKIEASRQEKIEEQRRIEERQRIIEARKEELRMKKEKESEELDKVLGGAELLEKKDFNEKEEFDDELV